MFKYDHYISLRKYNPKKAEEYRNSFRTQSRQESMSKREDNIEYLKSKWVRVFPNYKDETIERMVIENKEKEVLV